MNGKRISESMTLKLKNYVEHKIKIIEERVYWACIDKIYEAENYDEYEMDDDNNIYITYSLKKDESIILQPHDAITSQIINQYRRNLKFRLNKDDFHVVYKDDEINIFFMKPLIHNILNESSSDSDDDSDINENILIFKKDKEPENKCVEFGVIELISNDN